MRKIAISLIATSVLFTACGGGGGGGKDDTPAPIVTEKPADNFGSFKISTPTTYDVVSGKITNISILTGDDYINTNNGQSFYTYKVVDQGSATSAKFDATNYGNLRYINSGANDVVKISITDTRNGKTIEQDLTFNAIDLATAEDSAEPIHVLKTGQSSGDAGEDRNFVRTSQTNTGDVEDKVNNLVWSDTYGKYGYLALGDMTFTEAKKECEKSGGRLPTVDELFTTLTYADGRYQGSTFDTNMLDDAFKARTAAYFWADNGKIINYTTGQLTAGEKARFRCIVSGKISVDKHIMYTENDIITHDLSTGLQWTTSKTGLNFTEAEDYCNNLPTDIYGSGWKVPTINQLRSITEKGLIAAAILDGNPSLLSSTEVKAQGLPYHLFLLPTEGRTNYKVETAGEADVHAVTCVR